MNSIVFGGINSSTYGIYISGEGVWNAPERDAETIKIPGRNGEYILDHGNFKNIEVTYPAFNQEASYNDFRTKVDNFRNAISSLKGYQRLTDSFHPDEYRMAAFIGGLEVDPILYNDKSMQTNIVFNCKPQRFLTTGETQSSVTSGGTITNPTLFESHPLLLVDGYGDIDINGDDITIQQGALMGYVDLETKNTVTRATISGGERVYINRVISYPFNTIALNGDNGTTGGEKIDIILRAPGIVEDLDITPAVSDNGLAFCNSYGWGADTVNFHIEFNPMPFTVGQNKTVTEYITIPCALTVGGVAQSFNVMFQVYSEAYATGVFYTGVTFYANQNPNIPLTYDYTTAALGNAYAYTPISINSTKSALGNLYIDLDIGECYRIENGEYISINTATTLPADLPTLKPGANTITYSNTFTSFKVTPRWWRV